MEFIYGQSGEVIGSLGHDGNATTVYGPGGEFLGWTDDENVYEHDGSLLVRGRDGLGLLFKTESD